MKKRGLALSLRLIGPDNRSVDHWLKTAKILERSYSALKREAHAGDKMILQIASSIDPTDNLVFPPRKQKSMMVALEKRDVLRPAIMLAAMALECHFKAIISLQRNPPKGGHKLVELANIAKFPLQGTDEADLLELSRMIQLGRYHLTSHGSGDLSVSTSTTDSLLFRVRQFEPT